MRSPLRISLCLAALFSMPASLSAQTSVTPPPLSTIPQASGGEEKRGQAIATVYYSQSKRGFDDDGNVVDINDYDKLEVFLLAEYAVTDDLTLIFNPSFRDVSVEGGDNSTGLGYTALGARYDVLKDDDGWLALEGSVRIPGVERADNLAQVGSTDTEYDLRLRGFHNISVAGLPGFVDAQTSYRLRDGDPPNEFHGDLTVGVRPKQNLLLMAQSFNTISDGAGQGIFDSYRYHNVQFSAVQTVADGVSLQLGVVGTIAGENALRERGGFAAIWVDF